MMRFTCIATKDRSKIVLLFCSEESMAIPGVGVDKLVETGKLDHLKGGPLFWVDSADSNPCMGNYYIIMMADQAKISFIC